jgi:hypothetical protein
LRNIVESAKIMLSRTIKKKEPVSSWFNENVVPEIWYMWQYS